MSMPVYLYVRVYTITHVCVSLYSFTYMHVHVCVFCVCLRPVCAGRRGVPQTLECVMDSVSTQTRQPPHSYLTAW